MPSKPDEESVRLVGSDFPPRRLRRWRHARAREPPRICSNVLVACSQCICFLYWSFLLIFIVGLAALLIMASSQEPRASVDGVSSLAVGRPAHSPSIQPNSHPPPPLSLPLAPSATVKDQHPPGSSTTLPEHEAIVEISSPASQHDAMWTMSPVPAEWLASPPTDVALPPIAIPALVQLRTESSPPSPTQRPLPPSPPPPSLPEVPEPASPPIDVEPAPTRLGGYVRASATGLHLDGRPYRFVGINMWHAAWVAAQSVERLRDELDTLARAGVRVLRITACSEGPPGAPLQVVPTLQPEAGVFDEAMAASLDVVLHELRRRDMRAILVLNNMWTWSGGFASYLVWARGNSWRDIPYPSSHLKHYWEGADGQPKKLDGTWDEYQNWTCAFYSEEKATALAEATARFVLQRINSVSGLAYAHDPTVLAWELCNEPRAVSTRNKWHVRSAYMAWLKRTAALVKRLAPEQLVLVGSEGRTPFEDYVNVDFRATHALADVDAITIHVHAPTYPNMPL